MSFLVKSECFSGSIMTTKIHRLAITIFCVDVLNFVVSRVFVVVNLECGLSISVLV